jgi:iron-sulfur cluster insertion protein
MNNVELTESAKNRILEIKNNTNNPQKFLRLTVKSGGCSGFQYIFELDDKNLPDDLIICEENAGSVTNLIAKTDAVSLQFIEGSKIDFVEELGASYFKVVNPNATANCGCGSSFAV